MNLIRKYGAVSARPKAPDHTNANNFNPATVGLCWVGGEWSVAMIKMMVVLLLFYTMIKKKIGC